MKGSKILIVDDNQQNIILIANILKENNYKIAVAFDGEAAYKNALIFDPDIILMDISMPVMDG